MEKLEQYPFKVDALLKFGTDLTSMAKMGLLDPVVGRQHQIERLTQILCKRRKNNACLIGDAGVGKTVVVEGLAMKIAHGLAPQKLAQKKVFSIDMARLIAGAPNRGEFEERLIKLVDEVKQSEGLIILFIDELHTIIGAGGGGTALDAANILKPALASDRFLPDKAVDLIDEAGARVNLYRQTLPNGGVATVSETDIREVITMWTGIPLEQVTNEESNRLLVMEKTLKRRLIGQDEAVSAVSRAIRRARVGLRDMTQPIACFLFTGPTGVGKTELAKLLAAEYFGSKEAMVRLDMSEYMEKHNVARLIGSPPGYIGHDDGGQLTESVRQRPHTVILFDEIEKANAQVFNVLLQVLDDGRMTDGKGRRVDFNNTIIVMTSNVGGKLKAGNEGEMKRKVGEELSKFFKPEFLNRVDEIVVFKRLERAHLREILDVMLGDFYERVHDKKVVVEVSEMLKEMLISEGYSPSYGARPLKRAITRLLEDNLAEKILEGTVTKGQHVVMDVDSHGHVIILST